MKRQNKSPLISIITICYNEVKNIEKTCQSVFNQTEKDFEWIVIDGKSTDGTMDILKKYTSKITYFVSEKDKGIYNAMNKGIKRSRGDYLLFLNAGDFFKDKYVLKKVKEFIINDKRSNEIYYGDIEYSNGEKVDFSKSKLNKKFFISKTISHQGTFIKNRLFERYGLYNENYKIVSDFEFWIKTIVLNKAKTKHLPLTVSILEIQGISSNYKFVKEQIRERNEVLIRYNLISFSKSLINKLFWFFLSVLKKIRVYSFFRKIYRSIIKR
jgi:glycosyltransferase involved in cell wall biosynthesis